MSFNGEFEEIFYHITVFICINFHLNLFNINFPRISNIFFNFLLSLRLNFYISIRLVFFANFWLLNRYRLNLWFKFLFLNTIIIILFHQWTSTTSYECTTLSHETFFNHNIFKNVLIFFLLHLLIFCCIYQCMTSKEWIVHGKLIELVKFRRLHLLIKGSPRIKSFNYIKYFKVRFPK